MKGFRRARQPDQIEARRDALLVAAAELFDADGPRGAGLTAIAMRAGFTKSNVYRYFESREEVLLALFLQAFDRLTENIRSGISRLNAGDIPAIAQLITGCFLAEPRCCHLMSIFSTVLEQNVSEQTIESVKRHMRARSEILITSLADRLPGARMEDYTWVLSTIFSFVAGMWPGAHPAPAAATVLAKTEFAHMMLKPEHDMRRLVAALLAEISWRP
jgi:TetR/AcrR family transcriptional regulator